MGKRNTRRPLIPVKEAWALKLEGLSWPEVRDKLNEKYQVNWQSQSIRSAVEKSLVDR